MIDIREAGPEHVSAIVGLWHEMMDLHVRLNPFYALGGDAPVQAE